MDNESVARIKEAWKPNKIEKPVKTELYLNVIEQVANLFSAGSFYYYILNFETLQMEYVDKRIESILGFKPAEWSLDKAFELIHPEDLNQMHRKEAAAVDFLLNRIPPEDILHYKVVYVIRIRHANGSYKTILHQSKTLSLSEDKKAQQVLGIHTDVSYLDMPIDNKISFIGDGRPSYYAISTDDDFIPKQYNYETLFTPREKEILRNIANGQTFGEIAEILNISPHTINTHKKNILRKTDCKTTTELIARCVRDGII
ncbi:LuxR C-terminal-related transcriptional regulator [Maribellus sp. YY47]|uniref:LuxR C-terminal-related transcriptional regulator n=1 Tax=Maribellus sp. YY47 TaxID=2929486 RepID=UPI0020019CC9|nr:LuxR C-terminal-related transcriptional regulator [Maribellus sp. YY47]MCK3682610.1 LuxR C-terminal-related transcriptional regulator [Maribellus sp. YY47]